MDPCSFLGAVGRPHLDSSRDSSFYREIIGATGLSSGFLFAGRKRPTAFFDNKNTPCSEEQGV
jgi:hypothetical protein